MRPRMWRATVTAKMPRLLPIFRRLWGIEEVRLLGAVSWNTLFEAWGKELHVVVKVYNPGGALFNATDPSLVARLSQLLHQEGILPIVPPIPNKVGELVTRCGEFLCVVYPWVTGQDAGRQHVSQCARALLALHNAPLSLPARVGLSEPRAFEPVLGPAQWYAAQDTIWIRARARVSASGGGKSHLGLLDEAAAFAKRQAKSLTYLHGSHGEHLLHGDFRPSNILVTADGEIHVCDLDCVQLGLPEIDLATAALSFAGAEWLSGHVDVSALWKFIDAYRVAGQDDLDQRRLAAALSWVPLRAVSLVFKPEQIEGRLELVRQMAELLGPC